MQYIDQPGDDLARRFEVHDTPPKEVKVWSETPEVIAFPPVEQPDDGERLYPFRQRRLRGPALASPLVTAAVGEWRPRTPPPEFGLVIGWVRQTVLASGPASPKAATAGLLHLMRLAVWWVRQGLKLRVEEVLHFQTVERFCQEQYLGESSAATYRSHLRRIGGAVAPDAGWVDRAMPIARRSIAKPYELYQVERLLRDAIEQPSFELRRIAIAFVALGLGAGLDGRWNTDVRGTDVEVTEAGLLVHVDRPTRSVAVLSEWEATVRQMATVAGADFLVGKRIGSHQNRCNALVETLKRPVGAPRLDPTRLRSTWLRTHLDRGTRIPDLLYASGIKRLDGLTDHAVYVKRLPDAQGHHVVRGADHVLPFAIDLSKVTR